MNPKWLKITLILFLIGVVSCENDNSCNKHCINRIQWDQNEILVTQEELVTIKSLFESNNIDYSDLQFHSIYSVGDNDFIVVACYQYINNLKVWPYKILYYFLPDGTSDTHFPEKIVGLNLSPKSVSNENCVIESY